MNHQSYTAIEENLIKWRHHIGQRFMLQNANWNLEDKSHSFDQIKSLAENLYAPQIRVYSSLKNEFRKLSTYADTTVVAGRGSPLVMQKEKLQREKLVTVYVIYYHDGQQEAIAHLMSEPERMDLGSAELWNETLRRSSLKC